jgi:hypothetical protein
MAHEPIPCLDFGAQQLLGLSLVGTVALPSPFPAVARLYVVRYPALTGAKGDEAKPRLFLKLVETINAHHVVTRIIDPQDVRAIRWTAAKPPAKGAVAEPVLQAGDQARAEIAAIDWGKAVKDPANSYEVPLHPDETAMVYVAEAAPVLLRHEQTLPASVSVAASPALLSAACPHGSK